MSPPEVWGPPIWTFLHALAEKVNENRYIEIAPQLFFFIRKICRYLPCPDCSQHASQFFSRVNFASLKTKDDFKNILFMLHNAVNRRKFKPYFPHASLTEAYSNKKIVPVYNDFIRVFHTRGNMRLLAESFQRNMIVRDLKKWLTTNIAAFI
jgi:hypothetical protein